MNLSARIPFAAVTFVIAGMASMGIPGFSGFVAELMVLVGTWKAYPGAAICVGAGIVIGVAYVWRAMQRGFFKQSDGAAVETDENMAPITLPEKLGAAILIAASLVVGVYPQVVLRWIEPALNSPLFAALRGGGWR
jgi:NADH-quinone oxidoreductase subunit M